MNPTLPSAEGRDKADPFYDYYAAASMTPQAVQRFRAVRDMLVRMFPRLLEGPCNVADIGCGAGTQSCMWAELGCTVHGLDVNEHLIQLGQARSADAGFSIDFKVGSATALPWPDESIQVCLAVELLEHVREWKQCLREFCRILSPGGVLYASTSNVLCPFQQEFALPLYSWYPPAVKRYCERLAVTTRPELANHAKFPAVNWFTFYGLRDFLAEQGFHCYDRFDAMEASQKGTLGRAALAGIQRSGILRFFAYVATEGLSIVAVKNKR